MTFETNSIRVPRSEIYKIDASRFFLCRAIPPVRIPDYRVPIARLFPDPLEFFDKDSKTASHGYWFSDQAEPIARNTHRTKKTNNLHIDYLRNAPIRSIREEKKGSVQDVSFIREKTSIRQNRHHFEIRHVKGRVD